MSAGTERLLLRVHVGNRERWHAQPVYEALVERARRMGLAGATVLAAEAGYPVGRDAPHAHPMVIEIVEQERALQRFLAEADPLLAGHPVIVTLERAHVLPTTREQA